MLLSRFKEANEFVKKAKKKPLHHFERAFYEIRSSVVTSEHTLFP